MTLIAIKDALAPVEILRRLRKTVENRYEPSRYYMRGPGPKARARASLAACEQPRG